MINSRRLILAVLIIVMTASVLSGCTSGNAAEKENVKTINISMKARIGKLLMFKNHVNDKYLEGNFEQLRQEYLKELPQTFPETEVKNRLDREECGGFDVYTLSGGEYENIILFIHGGAWVEGIERGHVRFCDALAERLNAKVYIPLYPLAPKYCYEDTYKMIMELYDALSEEGKPIFVMGDSAGGTIALGLAERIKENGKGMPEKLVLISPCADLSFTNPDIDKLKEKDPMLAVYGLKECAKMWARDTDLKDPAVSPLYSDVSGYPETMMFVAADDILCPDAVILFDMLEKAGNDVTMVKGEGLWHVFPIASIPEQDTSLELITEFCKN